MRQFKRRLVTIISADVVGYSRLMGVDEEFTLSTLKTFRTLIAQTVTRYHGRIFGVAGDSWMAEFTSPVQAVQCAARIQHDLAAANKSIPDDRKVLFRLGLHLGDVIIDGTDLFGDEVNIAARLQAIAQPGEIVLSKTVYTYVAGKIQLEFKDLGLQHLKNISSPIGAVAAKVSDLPFFQDQGLSLESPPPQISAGSKPKIAVLPFEDYTNQKTNPYLVHTLSDELTYELGNIRWLSVLSQISSSFIKDSPLDFAQIGRALGVRYVVTARLHSTGPSLRLNVNLVEAESGINLWSQRYIDFNHLYETQNELIQRIVSTLEIEIEKAEYQRCRSTPLSNLTTPEILTIGACKMRTLTRLNQNQAFELFNTALQRDPYLGETHIQLGTYIFWQLWKGYSDKPNVNVPKLLQHANYAMSCDRRDARAHLLMGGAQIILGNAVAARPHLVNAIDLSPSLAAAHAAFGSSFIMTNEPEKGISSLTRAIRLNKHDLHQFIYHGQLAMAHYLLKDWSKAIEFAERSLQERPNYWSAILVYTASLAASDQIEAARRILEERSLDFTVQKIKSIVKAIPFIDKTAFRSIIRGIEKTGYKFDDNIIPFLPQKETDDTKGKDKPSENYKTSVA